MGNLTPHNIEVTPKKDKTREVPRSVNKENDSSMLKYRVPIDYAPEQ